MKEIEKLINAAKQASNNAYAPYSKFKVGSALLTAKNKIFTGANVENASYGLTVCAERVALFKAVSEGEKKFKAIAIYTNTQNLTYPCGACLQVLYEFSPKIKVIISNACGKIKQFFLSQLLPYPF
ncbi:MAG: cytidine deaminase [candidate division WOR-3 bacterium]|nr:cytidine deaminase [candidate division WOR-3 bacterium]